MCLNQPKVMRTVVLVVACLAAISMSPPVEASQRGKGPLKVFILAGQSNMEGKGAIEHLDQLVADYPTEYGHLKKDSQWIKRGDVWIKYGQKKGELTVGYGSPENRIGPELGFGHVLGEAIDNQILLIKVAWGGQSLALDFRPPSSGQPAFPLDEKTQKRIESGEYRVGMRFLVLRYSSIDG